MTRARDVANVLSTATDLATDTETAAAISAHNSVTNGHTSRGNTASRPASPTAGDIYVNTQTGFVEVYTGATYGWEQVGGISSTPTSVVATDSGTGRAYNNGSASVAFSPGTIAGRSYTVTSSPGSYTATGTTSPITITGLQSGVSYTYTATSTNNYGTSSASSASTGVVATTVPDAPTIGTPSSTGNVGEVTVTWTAPNNGGSSITGYIITPYIGATAQATTSAGSGATSVDVTGLTNGTTYTFKVAATNANGTGNQSSASSSVVPGNVTVDILIVAGGGGGGTNRGGGGGAGGLLSYTSYALSKSTTYSVTVGGGGAGSTVSQAPGTVGNDSQFGSLTLVKGGGYGGGNNTPNGGPGGSGGGGNGSAGAASGGTATSGQGNNGGSGSGDGGGGGGAGAVGLLNGGIGITSSLINSIGAATGYGQLSGGNYYFSGGGGGGADGGTPGTGGLGGGTSGTTFGSGQGASSATARTGGGGGGGGNNTPEGGTGGSGGSGLVVLRKLGTYTAASTTGSPSRTVSGGYTYYTWTANGSITL